MKIRTLLAAMAALLCVPAHAVDIEPYVRPDSYGAVRVSPHGAYVATVVPDERRSTLAVIERATGKIVGGFLPDKDMYVGDFYWANDKRLVVALAQKFGTRDQPSFTGELFGVDFDGSQSTLLIGYRKQSDASSLIRAAREETVYAEVTDTIPVDERRMLIATTPFEADAFSKAEYLDVYTGRRAIAGRIPVRNGRFLADNQHRVRVGWGSGADLVQKIYYRADAESEWKLVGDESQTGHVETPVGFTADDRGVYLQVEQASGPDRIVLWNPETGSRTDVLGDDVVDPSAIIYRPGSHVPVGAYFESDRLHAKFFDEQSPEARLQHALEGAFPRHDLALGSRTLDGAVTLFRVSGDDEPGRVYLHDRGTGQAAFVVAMRESTAASMLSPVEPVALVARDGTPLHGYLTRPAGTSGRALPLVVMPHGGPFGIRDVRGFDGDAQLLARAGYAVLQVNFRGSGGYGRAFQHAGARQWGKAMQDDVTDATRWAIDRGIADASRICLYGASYGGYAALMGVAREPALYKCAAGYVGVYDLPTMHSKGDIRTAGSGRTYLDQWVGKPDDVAATSPTRLADRIKVPVFLAAGGEDERAPIAHSRMMETALREAGVPVETLYFDTEGHGFYEARHRSEFYRRLLAFLARSLGGETADASEDKRSATTAR